MATADQLSTVLLARHFQRLHLEARQLAVGAHRSLLRMQRRSAQPTAFSFTAALNAEQVCVVGAIGG